MLNKKFIVLLFFCVFFLFACGDESQTDNSHDDISNSDGGEDGSRRDRPAERSQKIKQAEKKLIEAFNGSKCSSIVKDYYKDRIEDLERIYSDDQIVESRIKDMIKLIKDIGC